jgi:hypothetical protein
MMSKQEQGVGARGIPEIIALLSAKQASGRLKIVAGTTEGELLFNGGNLVDARLGQLTGFPAINTIAAMHDAYVEFNPSIDTPTTSSITSNERVVLKQFFGIDAVDSKHQPLPVIDDEDETTLITTNVPPARTEAPPRYRTRYRARRSRLNYRLVFAVCVLLIGLSLAATAWLLRQEYREQNTTPAVATTTESAPPPSSVANTTVNHQTIPANRDLTGNWNVVNTVHTSAYRSFQDMRIGFALSINQTGKTFTAQGQKVSENGRTLPAGDRTPIQLNGVIDGDRIEATFSEQGSARKTSGKFVWKMDRAGGLLTGTFASTAARASGKSTAKRQL